MTILQKPLKGKDNKFRCPWQRNIEDYLLYHDEEWGLPVIDDNKLFESICLEIFQSGLSWLIILRKRNALRETFYEFNIEKIASFTEKDVTRILNTPEVIHNRQKITSIINNARCALKIKEEFGSFSCYLWKFEPLHNFDKNSKNQSTPSENPIIKSSTQLVASLKKKGFTFIGITIIDSFMQASGLLNGHLKGCTMYEKIEDIRNAMIRP
ncbi:DNA-3-methyladenine glycosylase I [Candidatus Liberibacter sp.]|uniref:DNA-3-methyladenine glycosylase I n=1 Tax=Candidatus Liberibacter sp. TaxID=34022 RepID=UPI0015F5E12C|nr:DNA-3-methyladenine glycosylase I [Candidatus Liberibacter sp.]MBA5724640.1 DNA-3-methyladenine glycosylase I [Candidatus Liberibacter sp.]